MFPEQSKIELFARANYIGWDNWGLEIPNNKIDIPTSTELEKTNPQTNLFKNT